MRALGYYLYDTHGADSVSSEDQIREFCLEKQHNLVKVFHNSSLSEIDKFKEVISFIRESGLGFLVVIPSSNHLGADITVAVENILDVDQLGSEIRCIDKDFPDPIQGLANGLEPIRSELQEKMLVGMHQKAAGAFVMGKTPYGYHIGPDKKLAATNEEAIVVKAIFNLYGTEGLGLRKIADCLNKKGIKTRKANPWSMVTIRDILKNTTYIGTYTRFGLRLPNSHEAIIDPATFRVVQDLMTSRTPNRRKKYTNIFLLNKIGRCGYCGSPLMGVTRNQSWTTIKVEKTSRLYRYYQCQTATNRGTCSYNTWTAADLEEQVLNKVCDILNTDAGSTNSKSSPSLHPEEDLSHFNTQITNIKKRFERQIQRSATGLVTIYLLRQLYEQHKLELQNAETALEERKNLMSTPNSFNRASTIEKIQTATPEDKQAALGGLIFSLDVYTNSFEVVLRTS